MGENCNCQNNLYNGGLQGISEQPNSRLLIRNGSMFINCFIRRIKNLCISECVKEQMIKSILSLGWFTYGLARQPESESRLYNQLVISLIGIFNAYYPSELMKKCEEKTDYKCEDSSDDESSKKHRKHKHKHDKKCEKTQYESDYYKLFFDIDHLQYGVVDSVPVIQSILAKCYCNNTFITIG